MVEYSEMKRIASKFWKRVDRKDPEECWPWTSHRDADGYGQVQFRLDGSKMKHRAHLVALCLEVEKDIPQDVVVRHSCDNPPCANPSHLLTGGHADNVADRDRRGRTAKGEQNGRAKINVQQVENLRTNYKKYVRDKANELGVSEKLVRDVHQGKIWKHLE